jgi:hypothetical protein
MAMLLCVLWATAHTEELKGKLGERAPALTLDFGTSWSTNLTAVGGVLVTVLTLVTYPDVPREIDKDSLTALSLLFGGLVVVAPFVFQGLRRNPPDQEALRSLTGTNLGLALACCITFAAVVGELLALGLLGWELIGGGLGVVLLFAGIFVLGGLAANYTYRGIRDFLLRKWTDEANEAWKVTHQAPPAAAADAPQAVPPVVVATPSGPPRAALL